MKDTTKRAAAARSGTGRGRPDAQAPVDAQHLTRDDWLDAAYEAVCTAGFDAVRVLTLARTLGITRGSFYWHFADHAALVEAVVDRWRERELAADRALQSRVVDDPVDDLSALLDAALARGGADLKDMRFELALRGLGRRDPAVAAVLAEVDAVRLGLLAGKFERLVGDARQAADLAALMYLSVAGAHQALARPGTGARTAAYLREVIAEHLIRRQAPDAVPRPKPRAGRAPRVS